MFNRILLFLSFLFLAAGSVNAAGLKKTVCSSGCDYTTIDAAMAAVSADQTPPDTVYVKNGTYTLLSELSFKSGVVMISENGKNNTYVVPAATSRHFLFTGTISPNTRIGSTGHGFTFKSGAPAVGDGGSISIGTSLATSACSAIIEDCIFRGNTTAASEDGGAIAAYLTSPNAVSDSLRIVSCRFVSNTITHNTAGTAPKGGAIYFSRGGASASITSCTIDSTTIAGTGKQFTGLSVYLDNFKGKFNSNIVSNSISTSISTTGMTCAGVYVLTTYASGYYPAQFDNNELYNLTANTSPALYISGNLSTINGLSVHGNASGTGSPGAGAFYYSGSHFTLNDSKFYANTLTGAAHGAAFKVAGGTASTDTVFVNNCTFANNTSSSSSTAAIAFRASATYSSYMKFTNCLISHTNTTNKQFKLQSAGTTPAYIFNCSILWSSNASTTKAYGLALTTLGGFTNSDSSSAAGFDPTYCNMASGDLTINSASKANSNYGSCGLIGSESCGCGNCSGDVTAPNAISDLRGTDSTLTSITVSWTSPGDDGSTGTATSYDLRYSANEINSGNFNTATSVSDEPTPLVAGTTQSYTLSGLGYNNYRYFAIKTSDEVPNTSSISNVLYQKVLTNNDVIPPGQITDLGVTQSYPTGVQITWMAPHEDLDAGGDVTSYDIRWMPVDISGVYHLTLQNFPSATIFTKTTTPTTAGMYQTETVWGFPTGAGTFELGIISKDEAGNQSALSNIVRFTLPAEKTTLVSEMQKLYTLGHPRLFYNSAIKDSILAEESQGVDGDGSKHDLIRQIWNRANDKYTSGTPSALFDEDLLCEILYGLVESNSTYLNDAIWRFRKVTVINPSDDSDQWYYAIGYDWLYNSMTQAQRDSSLTLLLSTYDNSVLSNPSNRKGIFYNHEAGEAAIKVITGIAMWDSSLTSGQKDEIEKYIREGDGRMRGVREFAQSVTNTEYYGGSIESKQKYMADGGYYKGIQYGGKDFHYTAMYLDVMRDVGIADYWYNYGFYNNLPEYFWFNLRPDYTATRIASTNSFGVDYRWFIGYGPLTKYLNVTNTYTQAKNLANFAMNTKSWVYTLTDGSPITVCLWRPRQLASNPLDSEPLFKYYGNDNNYSDSWSSKVYIRDDWNIKYGTNTSWSQTTDNNLYFRFDAGDFFGDYNNYYQLLMEIYYKGALAAKAGGYAYSPYYTAHYSISASACVPVIVDTTVVNTTVTSGIPYRKFGNWWGTDYLYWDPGIENNIDDLSNGNEYDQADMLDFDYIIHSGTETPGYHMRGRVNKSSSYYYSNAYRDMKKMEREIFKYGNYFVVRDSLRVGSTTKQLKVLTQIINEPTMTSAVSDTQFVKLYFTPYRRTSGGTYTAITPSNGHVTAIRTNLSSDSSACTWDATNSRYEKKWTSNGKSYNIWEREGTDSLVCVLVTGEAIGDGIGVSMPPTRNYILNYNRGRFSSTRNDTYSSITYTGKLTVDPLLPTDLKLRKVGSLGQAGWIDDGFGKGVNILYAKGRLSDGAPDTSLYHDGQECVQWRVESTCPSGNSKTEFLHVYFAGSSSGSYAATTMQECTAINVVGPTSGLGVSVGVEIDSTATIVFAKTKAIAAGDTLRYYFGGAESQPHFITGLAESITYSVRKKAQTNNQATQYASTGDGNLTFTMSGTDTIFVYKYNPNILYGPTNKKSVIRSNNGTIRSGIDVTIN